jgi:hypothetical protein
MRNIPAIALGILCFSAAAFADKARVAPSHGFLQDHNLRVGVDTEVGIPLGNYSDQNSVGAGAFLDAELALLDTVSGTLRIGFEAHMDRSLGGVDSHVHAIPMLLGGKAWFGQERQGMFGAFELGMFDLMSSVTRGAAPATTSNDLRFGMGAGLGYQQSRWNARVTLYTQDVGHFGSTMMISGGIGYQFGGL